MATNVAQLRPDVDPLAALDPVLLHALTAHAHEVVSIIDRSGQVLFLGGAIEPIFGYRPGEWRGHSVLDIVHPDEVDYVRMRLGELLSDAEHQDLDVVAARIRHRDGQYLNCEISGAPLRHAGATALLVLHTRDVTTQARALRRSAAAEVRLEAVIRGADVGLWEFDRATGLMTRTEDWFARHGLPGLVDGRPGRYWYERIHPDDLDRVQRVAAERIAGPQNQYILQYRLRSGSGAWVWIAEHVSTIARNPDGSARILAGVCLCVDEIKQLEAELEIAQQRLRLAVEASGMALWDWLPAEGIVYRTANWETLLRFEPSATEPWSRRPGADVDSFHPDDLKHAADALAAHTSGIADTLVYEARRRCGDGSWRWMRTNGRTVEHAPDGSPLRVVGCTTDVHERRVAEQRLAESELRFRTASSIGHEHIAELALDERGCMSPLWWSDGLPPALGCTPEQFAIHCGTGWVIDPPVLAGFLAMHSEVLAGNSREIATRLVALDGRVLRVRMVCQPIAHGPDGAVTRVLCTVLETHHHDVAGSKSGGLAQLQQTMLEYVPACLVLLGTDRRIRCANRALTQHLPDASVGLELEECFHPRWRALIGAAITRSRDEQCNVEVEGIAPAAARLANRSYRLHVAPACSHGAFAGWCVVVRDVTGRRNEDADAFTALGRDPQRIGHELHDGVGQQLTGAVFMMQTLVNELVAERHHLAADAERVQGLMNQSIDDVRMLASGLSPVGTAPTGLSAAMHSLAARTRSLGRLTVDLHVAVEPGHQLSAVEGDHLYWIAQEAVTNAIRHSGATHLELRLEVDGDRFHLQVADDGRGVNAGSGGSGGADDGSGLKLMLHRARGLGATFTLTPRASGGTLITCVRAARN